MSNSPVLLPNQELEDVLSGDTIAFVTCCTELLTSDIRVVETVTEVGPGEWRLTYADGDWEVRYTNGREDLLIARNVA